MLHRTLTQLLDIKLRKLRRDRSTERHWQNFEKQIAQADVLNDESVGTDGVRWFPWSQGGIHPEWGNQDGYLDTAENLNANALERWMVPPLIHWLESCSWLVHARCPASQPRLQWRGFQYQYGRVIKTSWSCIHRFHSCQSRISITVGVLDRYVLSVL